MSANVFCDFANKEIRRVYGLYANLADAEHQRVLSRWLRIAVLLSPDWVLIPLGFVAESRLLQRVLVESEALLLARIVRLSVRDSEIGKFIDRRREEYRPYSADYAPLFHDETVELLLRYAVAIHERVGNTAQRIGARWPLAIETESALEGLRGDLTRPDIARVADLPGRISDEGLGFTWNAISERIPKVSDASAEALRRFLHGDFVRGYLREYDLQVITGLPFGWRDLGVQPRGGPLDFERFSACVEPLGVLDILLQLTGADLLRLRREAGFIAFQQAYDSVAGSDASTRQLRLAFTEASSPLAALRISFFSAWSPTASETRRTDGEALAILAYYLAEAAGRAADRLAPAGGARVAIGAPRVYLEDVAELRDAGRIPAADTLPHLTNGRVDVSEDDVQAALERLLAVPFHRKDWGGETNDLYTSNVHIGGSRVAAAFLLKGRGLKAREMQIADCGKNGDQLVRLTESPAQLFVVQYVGPIADAVIKDIDGKVARLRNEGVRAHYCIIDGQETAKLLAATGRLPPAK